MSAAAMSDTARQLCAHIKALKAVHRAGLTPSFGQVEELFDRAADLDQLLGPASVAHQVRVCTRPSCGCAATTMVGASPLCQACGDVARTLLRNLESLGVAAPVSVRWPSADLGGFSILDPRD